MDSINDYFQLFLAFKNVFSLFYSLTSVYISGECGSRSNCTLVCHRRDINTLIWKGDLWLERELGEEEKRGE